MLRDEWNNHVPEQTVVFSHFWFCYFVQKISKCILFFCAGVRLINITWQVRASNHRHRFQKADGSSGDTWGSTRHVKNSTCDCPSLKQTRHKSLARAPEFCTAIELAAGWHGRQHEELSDQSACFGANSTPNTERRILTRHSMTSVQIEEETGGFLAWISSFFLNATKECLLFDCFHCRLPCYPCIYDAFTTHNKKNSSI